MQSVGFVAVNGCQPGGDHLALQFVLRIDAHMTANGFRGVIAVIQRPADAFGELSRHCHRQSAARLQHADELSQGASVIMDVLQHL